MQSEITNRKLGIEIEVVVPIIGQGEGRDVQDLLARVLSNHGIPAVSRGYTRHAIPTGCLLAIEHDASLQDETRYQGLRWSKLEIKTAPMSWSELERILPPALDIIRYFGARVNHSCGLHVHHHLPEVIDRPLVVRNLQHLWWRFHEVVSAHRYHSARRAAAGDRAGSRGRVQWVDLGVLRRRAAPLWTRRTRPSTT